MKTNSNFITNTINDNTSSTIDKKIAKLLVIGGVISTVGGIISTYASVLALQSLQQQNNSREAKNSYSNNYY